MSSTKNEVSTSNFEVDFQEPHPKQRLVSMLESARVALSAVILAAGITILGLSAASLAVYDRTYLPDDYLLPLWPESFNIRPMKALLAASVIVTVVTAAALVASKIQSLRNNPLVNLATSFALPLIGFVVAFIAMTFYYAVNTSDNVETFQSWTCRWQDVAMRTEPHFGTLCKQSRAGLGLAVAIVPLEAVVLGLAAYQMILERNIESTSASRSRKAASPALS